MKLATFCQSKDFCPCCYETGGEYNAPLSFYCNTELCGTTDRNCLFVQHGGKRP
jgi:hypothetical protein